MIAILIRNALIPPVNSTIVLRMFCIPLALIDKTSCLQLIEVLLAFQISK
jgi:hypothetical protein